MSIVDGVVYIDGKKVEDLDREPVKITVEGSIGNVKVDGSLEIEGHVEGDINARGNVICWNAYGDVKAKGNVHIGDDAKMDVQAGGNVSVDGKVIGSVKAGGNVSHHK